MRDPAALGSTRSEIKAEFRSPSVQLGELPGLRPHREMFMPGSRLMEAEFGDELVHLGIKLDYHSVGVIVIAGYIVARHVSRRTPQLIDPVRPKAVCRHRMICRVLEF